MITTLAISVFIAGAALIVYVLFGYPLLLAWLSGRSHRPVRKQRIQKTVSILLPVYNGEDWIQAKLRTLRALDYPTELVELLIVSDGSSDGTESLVAAHAPPNARLIALPRGGKAIALNTAIAEARGELLFFTDIRQELSPNSLQSLVDCFADPEVGVATGELFILNGETREEGNVGLYWKYEKWIRSRLSRIDSILGATGCIYAMRRELAVSLPPGALLDDMHLPLAAFFRGFRIVWEPEAKAFDFPALLGNEFDRKVRTLAGNYQIIKAYPGLLGFSNRMWLHFVSHKLGRLLLPFALIAVFVASFGLPWPWNTILLIGQLLFYGLAAVDTVMPDEVVLKRITSPIRTFAVMMAAAFVAASILFVPSDRLWKQSEIRRTRPVAG